MRSSETRSGTTPLHHHPLVLPTLFVVGGWVLLLGGYIPGRTTLPSGAPPNHSPSEGSPSAPSQVPEPSQPTVLTIVDGRSSSAPFRLTIEFPHDPTELASISVPDPNPTETRASKAGWEFEPHSAPFDSQTIRTRTALVEEPVVPPPIPGPPPEFDPTILSPLIPESVPDSPMFEQDATAGPLIAQPMEDLPDAFDPGPLLDRYRSDEPWIAEQDETTVEGTETASNVTTTSTGDRGDQAPAPPAVPDMLPQFSTAPVILPEPSPDLDEQPQSSLPSIPAPAFPPIDSQSTRPPVPIQLPPTPPRRGLRGLFRAFRPPPPIPLVPPPPGIPAEVSPEQRAEPFSTRYDPAVPSDVLRQTDSLFRSAPTVAPASLRD